MSLTHPEFLSSLGNASTLILFVFLFGTLSLIMSSPKTGGGKKAADKKDKKNDPGDDPVNFFDGVTASVVASTAGDNEPEAARLPDNFFDSATMAVMGKQSAEQLKEFDELQNPKSFFDRFGESVMGLGAAPALPGAIIREGETVPRVPEVPFMSKDIAGGKSEARAEATHEKELRLAEVMHAKEAAVEHRRIEKIAEDIKRHEAEEGLEARKKHQTEMALAMIRRRHQMELEKEKEKKKGGGKPQKAHAEGEGFLSEPITAINELKSNIDYLLKQKWLDDKSRQMLLQVRDLGNQAEKTVQQLKEDERKKLAEIFGPENVEMMERMFGDKPKSGKGKESEAPQEDEQQEQVKGLDKDAQGFLGETAQLIKSMKTNIDDLLKQKWLDDNSRQMLEQTKKLLDEADLNEKQLKESEKKKLRELLGPENAELLENMWQEKTEEKQKQQKGKDPQSPDQKSGQLDLIKDNLKVCSLSDDNKLVALNPLILGRLNYDAWKYAKAC